MAGYALLVLIVSLIPVPSQTGVGHLDKAAHVCEYLLFAWLLKRGWRASGAPESIGRRRAWIAATVYGGLMELLQGLTPHRTPETADAVTNLLGALLGAAL